MVIGEWCYFADKEMNILKLGYEFDPNDFTKSERLRLLRLNACLQYLLEKLSSIIEYVPIEFKKRKIYM